MHKYSSNIVPEKVGVVGGSGYAGLELVRLLQKHPYARLRACFSSNPEFTFGDFLPTQGAQGIPVIGLKDLEAWLPELHTVFLATPAEVSLHLAPQILKAGANVIDLSGAFRLKDGTVEERVKAYEHWYQLEHPCPELLDKAEYGLLPWLDAGISTADEAKAVPGEPRLIANPGCYATSVLMAILPLLKRGLIRPETLVIDAKSGASGGGRKASENLLFTEVEGECLPYRVGKHQHLPEIRSFTQAFSGQEIDPMFTTHLLCIRRGILSSIYAKTADKVTELDFTSAFAQDYSDYGLVQWSSLKGRSPRAMAFELSLKRVVGTALTRVHFQLEGDRVYLFSLLDNLIKGAAGQAVENFNRLLGAPARTSLSELEGVL
jgi:N-acetyl-gamma-glutamyl-phosphate reductase